MIPWGLLSSMASITDHFWLAWGVALALLGVIASYLDRSAAMRGTYGQPPPWIVDKLLRLFFFTILVSPTCFRFPWLAVVYLLYLPSYLDGSERNGGRPNEWIGTWRIWHWMKDRFGLELVVTGKLDAKHKYIFGLHPHGILPFGGMLNFQSGVSSRKALLPNVEIRSLAASFVFYVPIYRDLLLAAGVCDASRYSARKLLDDNTSLLLVPGGATEALYAKPGANTLVLRRRLGFVRLALQTGAWLVPAFSFGENNTFDQLSVDSPTVDRIKRKFQRIFGISLPLLKNIIPRKCKVVTVVGPPVELPQIPSPTDDQVRQYLDVYIAAVETLFNKHKQQYSPESAPLVVL